MAVKVQFVCENSAEDVQEVQAVGSNRSRVSSLSLQNMDQIHFQCLFFLGSTFCLRAYGQKNRLRIQQMLQFTASDTAEMQDVGADSSMPLGKW